MGTAPAADHGWLAKVLAGDRLACGLLELARTLPADEWDALARRVEGVVAGTPVAEAEAMLRPGAGIGGKAWTLAAGAGLQVRPCSFWPTDCKDVRTARSKNRP